MFNAEIYKARRAELRRRIGSGLILLPGNSEAPRNYFDNAYAFRQDSSFLYYFGLQQPDLVGVLDVDSGEDMLFGDDCSIDDIIWMGPQPSMVERGAWVGVERTAPLAAAAEVVGKAIRAGRKVHFLMPYRGRTVLQVARLTGIDPLRMVEHLSPELAVAIAAMREVKGPEELEELENAFEVGYAMHTAAMRATREGISERMVAGEMEGITHQLGEGVSFHSIVSQHGETLHNHSHEGILTNGKLLLVDAGGESVNNYCSDHTRTFPVSGKFTDVQRDVYNVVLRSHDRVIEEARPGKYMDLHNLALRTLVEGLAGLGLVKGNPDDAFEAGVAGLFMPHGLGHGIGLDVHDCENMGERGLGANFAPIAATGKVDSCIMRSAWMLRPGTVLSDEPGIYFIPALIEQWKAEGKCKEFVAYDKLEKFYDFGGIRIEDDLVITENGCYQIGRDKHIPVTVEEIEAYMAK